MGRPHRRGPDVDPDPYHPYGYQYDRPVDPYDDIYPPRGRSPGPRRRNRSEPATAAPASYDAYDRDHDPREEPRESRRHHKDGKDHKDRKDRKDKDRKDRKEPKEPTGAAPDDYVAQVDPRQDRKSHKDRYYDDGVYPRRARSHGRSAGGPYRTTDDYEDFDAYEPASRRGRERNHAYHPPRTSETRRSRYPDYDPEPRPSDKRRSRYAGYPEYPDHDADPRMGDRRRSRHPDYVDVPRASGESNRARYPDYEDDPRSRPREHASEGRGRWRNDSPGRYTQPARQRSVRGRSMPRNGAVGGPGSGGRPRAKSAVGYAALGEAAQTAFRVGSQAAYQMRNEPGPWIGDKGTRVATAALGAALVDTFVGHKAANMKGGMRHQALRQACEMGIRNFVMQPAVNSANHRSDSGGRGGSGRKRR